MKKIFIIIGLFLFLEGAIAQDQAIPFEAENAGEIGSDFNVITEDGVTYVTPATDFASGTNPGTSEKVLTFEVTFAAPGTYDLYAKVRVGPNGADDDSFYFASGFGVKAPNSEDDWVRVNNIGNGAAAHDDYVLSPSENTVGNGFFKWINASETGEGDPGGTTFTVDENNLTVTFQIGSRENGLDIDKIAFGNSSLFYTVGNLENGEAGVIEVPDPEKPDPIALNAEKFLGSGYTPASFNFNWYWNQITPGNAGKWGSVEGTRDQMNWTVMDQTYNLGKDNDMYVKYHVLVWGSQQPGWIQDLPPAEQLEEIREWFTAVAERYPDLDAIEVVNEPLHQPPDAAHEGDYIEALGGTGETGWDWVINSFELAREIFPESVKLMINDYGIIADGNATQQYLELIELLIERGLLDQIGVQGHAFNLNNAIPNIVNANLNILGNTGLPVFVTELDLDGFDDYVQLRRYQQIFPVIWENEHIEGVTIWGYAAADHWRADQGAYLINPDGSLRPSFIWLRAYVEGNFTPISEITISSEDDRVSIDTPDGTLQLFANLLPEEATLGNIEWSSNNPAIATVDENGLVTAVNDGPVIITAIAQDGSEIESSISLNITGQETVTSVEDEAVFTIYPNPSDNGYFQINGIDPGTQVSVYDLHGRLILSQKTTESRASLEIPGDKGVYVINLTNVKYSETRKLMVK